MLINCTITQGWAFDGSAVYGGRGGRPHLMNCVVWHHDPPSLAADEAGSVNVTYSLTQWSWSGEGNILGDPAFVHLDDLRLSAGSPCIDAGNNKALRSYTGGDMNGGPRFTDDPLVGDSGIGRPPIVDMGAYEYAGRDVKAPWRRAR
jgi:hypothetical protein